MGNFQILSFGTHQNFEFLAEILTPKLRAYMVIFSSPEHLGSLVSL